MIAWFTLQRLKLIGIGILILAAVWWHRHAVAESYRQGTKDGEQSTLKEAAAWVEADTAARRQALDQKEADLTLQAAQIDGERTALNSARAGVNAALSAGLSQIAAQGVDLKHEIQTVPDTDVNGRFRLSLDRARTAEHERAAHP